MSSADNLKIANSLDPDQARHLSNLFDTLMVFLKEFFEKVYFEKSADDNKRVKNYSVGRELLNRVTQTEWSH